MPSIASSTLYSTELFRSQTQHHAFPWDIIQGMLAPTGATSEAVNQMDDFIRQFFIFDMPKNFFIQMAIAGAWICVLFIIGNTCVIHRMIQRAFWLFKFQKRTEGTYVVPNALNSFLFFEGFFAIVWLAFIVVNYEAFWLKNATMQYHIGVFNLIIWWPLYMGAFMAGWGSFYTAPGALEKGPFTSTKIGRLASRPLIINISCLGTPFLLIGSLLAPIILTQKHYSTSFNAYQTLHVDLMEAIESSPDNILSSAIAPNYLRRASQVWEMQTVSIWYSSIGFAVWSVWAGILLLFYIPAGGYLCYQLWKQLRSQKAMLTVLELQKMELEQMDGKRNEEDKEEGGEEEEEEERPAVLLFQPLKEKTYQKSKLSGHGESSAQLINTAAVDNLDSPSTVVLGQNDTNKGEEEKIDEEDKESDDSEPDYFFPPLAPAIKQRTVKQQRTDKSTPQSRYKYLRRCFINLSVLYVGIVFGASLYLGVAAALAGLYYESYLSNPRDCMQLMYVCMVVTAWGAVLFGTLTIFAILARFADPANASYQEESQAKKIRHLPVPKFLSSRSTSDKTLVGSAAAGQPKGYSQSMLASQQQSMEILNSISTSPDRGIKFRLRKKAGNIIMQPAADTSLHALGESISVDMTEHVRSEVSRRVPSFVPEDMTQGSVFEDEMQLTTRRNGRSRSLTIQSTSYGDMLREPRPLAPERPPPLSPSLVEPRPAPSPPLISPGMTSRYETPLSRYTGQLTTSPTDTVTPLPSSAITAYPINTQQTWQIPDYSTAGQHLIVTINLNQDQGVLLRDQTARVSYPPDIAYTAPTTFPSGRRSSPGVFF